jgi:hypothetical protein
MRQTEGNDMNNLNYSEELAARLFAAGLLLASADSALAEVRDVDVNSANPITAKHRFYQLSQ